MLTELNPPVIEIALCIFGNTIDSTHVQAQNITVHMMFLLSINKPLITF